MEFPNEYLITLPCFLCEKPFNNMDELQQHLNLHTFEPDLDKSNDFFICNLCGRNLRSRQALDGHYKRYHEAHVKAKLKCNTMPSEFFEIFECPNCDEVYIEKEYLTDHLKVKHNMQQGKKISEVPAAPKRQYPLRSPYFNPNLWWKNELEA